MFTVRAPSVYVGFAWPVSVLIGLMVGENCTTTGWGTLFPAGDPGTPPPQAVANRDERAAKAMVVE